MRQMIAVCLGAWLLWSIPARAADFAVPAPGHAAAEAAEEQSQKKDGGEAEPAAKSAFPVHPWELPPVDVRADRPLREEQRVGDYKQPRWSTSRLFPNP